MASRTLMLLTGPHLRPPNSNSRLPVSVKALPAARESSNSWLLLVSLANVHASGEFVSLEDRGEVRFECASPTNGSPFDDDQGTHDGHSHDRYGTRHGTWCTDQCNGCGGQDHHQ